MKKALIFALVLVLVFGLAACGSSSGSTGSSSTGSSGSSSSGSSGAIGADASAIADTGTSSGALAGGVTTMTEGYEVITTEGKSENVSIVVAQDTDIAALAPFSQGAGRNQTKYLQYDNLAVMHYPGGEVDEMDWVIAKDIRQVDADTYDIEIYDYVHDWAGNAITASDVVFSYEEYAASGASGKFARGLGSIVALDDYTVRLTIKDNSLGFAQYMLQQCPIVDEDAYKSQTEGELAQYPYGTGMYKVTDYVAGGYCTLTRVDDYWQTDESLWPYLYSGQIQEVKFVIMTEASQRAIGLENGSVDVVPTVAMEDVGNFMNDDGTAKEGYNVLKVLNSVVSAIRFNLSDYSPCSDINVRKAVTYAIDRAGVMNGTYGKGGWLPTNEYATAVVGDYNPDWTWHEYDLDAAKKALADAGYAEGELTLVFQCESTAYNKTVAELVQAYLSAIGVNVDIQALDSVLSQEYQKDPTKWDLSMGSSGSSEYCMDSWNLMFPLTYTEVDGIAVNSALIHDEYGYELIAKAGALETHTQENVDAVHDYALENYYYIPLGTYYKYSAAHDNLLLWAVHPFNYVTFGGLIYE